eukprot:XP_011660741.1 PREDICTED: protein arginine N-methyltransferase 5-like [Strongylocentrotus purpuratus]
MAHQSTPFRGSSVVKPGCTRTFDFVAMPIVHPRFQREFVEGKAKDRVAAFARSDLLLPSQDWSALVVGKLSEWLQVDAENTVVRQNSQVALMQELNYAAHLSLPAVLVPLNNINCVNLARCLYSHMQGHSNHQETSGMLQES